MNLSTAEHPTGSNFAPPRAATPTPAQLGAPTASSQPEDRLEPILRALAEPQHPHHLHHSYSYSPPHSNSAPAPSSSRYNPYSTRPAATLQQRRATTAAPYNQHPDSYHYHFPPPLPPWQSYSDHPHPSTPLPTFDPDAAPLPPLPPLPPPLPPLPHKSPRPKTYTNVRKAPHSVYGLPRIGFAPSETGWATNGGGAASSQGRNNGGWRASGEELMGVDDHGTGLQDDFAAPTAATATTQLDILFCTQTGQCRQAVSLAAPDGVVLITFPANGWTHVYEQNAEIFPWTGNGNNWIKGQVSGNPCDCGFHWRTGNGLGYKRPAVIREHLSKCSKIGADDPLAKFCRLTREQDKARSEEAKRLVAKSKGIALQANAEQGA